MLLNLFPTLGEIYGKKEEAKAIVLLDVSRKFRMKKKQFFI